MKNSININNLSDFELAVLIRSVEEKFLELFETGDLNGTVHTCIGQELSAVTICKYLKNSDYVFSNHRCHGHFIAFTKQYHNLISELMGKESGVCAGIGGSQHLCNKNFFSNGPQGSLAPIAVGVAKAFKLLREDNIAVCFIGDGTMGEGIIYESMNMASLYKTPIVFVCENNQYAQSTPISRNLAGSIMERAGAFGLEVYKSNTWDYDALNKNAQEAIKSVREGGNPVFFEIDTYRLKAHSKGDDDRDKKEVDYYESIDLISQKLSNEKSLISFYEEIKSDINSYVDIARNHKELSLRDYLGERYNKSEEIIKWENCNIEIHKKQVLQINRFFHEAIDNNKKIILIGEDIDDPYGGAFKVSKGLSSVSKTNIISTPISEAGIVGMGIGMSLLGYNPFIEIMFGDFIGYSFDQILSNASKFFYMYNKQVTTPITIRTPMGGGRGYGPTHSQSIEKIFNGLNNIQIIALNTLIDCNLIFKTVENTKHATILIENKIDYGRLENKLPKTVNYCFKKSNSDLPIIVGAPDKIKPEISIITYGGSVHCALGSVDEIFYEFEVFPKIIVLTELYPINFSIIASLVMETNIVLTVEESNIEGGFGSEIIAGLVEKNGTADRIFKRVGSINVPIPSSKTLEQKILVNNDMIIDTLRSII